MPNLKLKQYLYNPHRHVKIWLSNKPSVFLNAENQMRLIDMRYINPTDEINLIYDSSLLNAQAIKELNTFCCDYDINPVDANQFKNTLTTENERKLFEFYTDEITHLNEGGNLAVASDIIRWLPQVYSHGTYTDFDVPVDTTHLPPMTAVHAPLLMNIGSLRIRKKEIVISNNDYIAVVDPVAATDAIKKVQDGLIEVLGKYTTDFVEQTEQDIGADSYINRFLIRFMRHRSESIYIAKSKSLFLDESTPTSRELRGHINDVMTDQDKFIDFNRITACETRESVIKRLRDDLSNQLGFVKWLFFRSEYNEIDMMLSQSDEQFLSLLMKKERSMYIKSIVVCTTGPIAIAKSLFNGYVFSTKYFTEQLQSFSFNNYGLQKAFHSKNSIAMHENILGMLRFLGAEEGELNDSSWLETGAQLQKNREEILAAHKRNLQQSLHSDLSLIKHGMERHSKKIEADSRGFFKFYRSASRNAKIDALYKILACFKPGPDTEFNLIEFKEALRGIDLNKDEVFEGLFYSRTQDLIEQLEKLCHESFVFGITKGRTISFKSNAGVFPEGSESEKISLKHSNRKDETLHTYGLSFFISKPEDNHKIAPTIEITKGFGG